MTINLFFHKKTRQSQSISDCGIRISIPIMDSPARPSLSNLNSNTPMLRTIFNPVFISIHIRISSNNTTRTYTPEYYEEANYNDVKNKSSASSNMMYTKTLPYYICNKEGAPM